MRNRRLAASLTLIGTLTATAVALAETRAPRTIDRDTTWSAAEGPYIVTEDMLVTSGATLTISSGTVVRFGLNLRLEVRGGLIVAGDPKRRVVFTSSETYPGAWRGIQIWQNDPGRPSRLAHFTMSYGGALALSDSPVLLDDATVTDSDGIVIKGYDARVTRIQNSTITRNRGCGIRVESDARPVVTKTTIAANADYAICVGQAFYRVGQSPTALLLSDVVASGNGGGAKDAIGFSETVSGGDETLTPGLDWVILGSILAVRPGARLTILPNTTLRFGRGVSLSVRGTLIANGTPDRPVRMTAAGSERWQGLYFTGECSASILRSTVLSRSVRAVSVDRGTPRFENLTVEDSQNPAILVAPKR